MLMTNPQIFLLTPDVDVVILTTGKDAIMKVSVGGALEEKAKCSDPR